MVVGVVGGEMVLRCSLLILGALLVVCGLPLELLEGLRSGPKKETRFGAFSGLRWSSWPLEVLKFRSFHWN
jgi:hypothetical protein